MMRHVTSRIFIACMCASALGLWSCTELLEDHATPPPEQPSQPISLEEAAYHKGTESWIRPPKAPYTLANFQKAYDNLSAQKSTQTLTRTQTAEFSETEQLQATHYCIKIYPKNEKEQWKVELMDDIKVVYIPFDYVLLTKEETESLTITRSETTTYPEESPHKVTHDDYETIDGPVAPKTYTMPILYTVWPCAKPLPEDLDYQIDYAIFLPSDAIQTRSAKLSADARQLLEREAIDIALGSYAQTKPTRSDVKIIENFTGGCFAYDSFMNKDLPLGDLKIRGLLGSNIKETYTLQNGWFTFASPVAFQCDVLLSSSTTLGDIYTLHYYCSINIDGTIDGKPLTLHIAEITP